MQDVVDLKNNQWRKLREDVCPKTLQQGNGIKLE
jgi:hypothetical protein